jgi:hypothetical protein
VTLGAQLGTLRINGYRFLQTDKCHQNPGSMINDCKDKEKYNCYLYLSKESSANREKFARNENKGYRTQFRLFVVASKPISKGSELYLSYGTSYWLRWDVLYNK